MSIYKEFMYASPYVISLVTMTGVIVDAEEILQDPPIIQIYAYEFLWGVINMIIARGAFYVGIKLWWKRRFQKFLNSPYLQDYDNP